MSVALTVVALVVSLAASVYGTTHPAFGLWWFGAITVVCMAITAVYAAQRNWHDVVWFAVLTALNAWNWWDCRRKKRRKRAPRAYGAKSRALIAALTAKARAAAKPRPVLRPVPGGAR